MALHPGRAVRLLRRSFEVDRDAGAYLQPFNASGGCLPQPTLRRAISKADIDTDANMSSATGPLRRDNNRSGSKRCKILGGSVDGSTALVVFEADLNGRRQRGGSRAALAGKIWKVRDHGDWAP